MCTNEGATEILLLLANALSRSRDHHNLDELVYSSRDLSLALAYNVYALY
jgi:hypothetical protein